MLRGLDAVLLSEVNRQLQDRGLKVGNALAAVVDATIVEITARRVLLANKGLSSAACRFGFGLNMPRNSGCRCVV